MERLLEGLAGPVVLVGVGRADRGDDGFGPALARALAGCEGLDVLDCGDRPEDYTAEIVRSEPRSILIADAVRMGARPGETALLDATALESGWGETHRASLRALMHYLEWRSGARVWLLAAEPGPIADGDELGPEMAATVTRLAAVVERMVAANRRVETRP